MGRLRRLMATSAVAVASSSRVSPPPRIHLRSTLRPTLNRPSEPTDPPIPATGREVLF